MDKVSFFIYHPNGKSTVSRNVIALIAWVAAIGVEFVSGSKLAGTILGACAFLLTLYYLASAGSTHEALDGTLSGEISFDNDQIIAEDKVFKIQDINGFDFKIDDYYNRKITRLYKSVDPCLSQGIDNYLKFTGSNNTEYLFKYQLKKIDDWQSLIPFINHLVQIKKMTFKDAVDLIGIENVKI